MYKDYWVVDVESDGLLPTVTKLHCIVVRNVGSDRVKVFSSKDNSIELGVDFIKSILDSDTGMIVAHNASFDMGTLFKLFNINILDYYKKVICTYQLGVLQYPKHKLEKEAFNANIPLTKNGYKDVNKYGSYSLDTWGNRLNIDDGKSSYIGVSEATYIDVESLTDDEKQSIIKVFTKVGIHNFTVPLLSSKTQKKLIIKFPNIKFEDATSKQRYEARWSVVALDDCTDYCVQDTKVTSDLFKFLMSNEYVPKKSVLQIEVYCSFIACIQTIYGWKIDMNKLAKLDASLHIQLKQIDMKLSSSFLPFYVVDGIPPYSHTWKHIFTLLDAFTDITVYDLVESTTVSAELLQLVRGMISIDDEVRGKFPVKLNDDGLLEKYMNMSNLFPDMVRHYTEFKSSSSWLPIDLGTIPNSVGKSLCSALAYTKAGKPKSIKAWNKILKEEDGVWYRKLPKTTTLLRTPIKLKEFKAGSRPSILSFMERKYDWRPIELTDSGSRKLDTESFSKLPFEEAPLLAERFKVNKMISEINTIKGAIIGDRIHHSLDVLGASSTFRMAAHHPCLHQINSDKRFRQLFIMPDGYDFIGADESSVELVLFAIALQPYDGGKMIIAVTKGDKSKGTDVHSLNAKAAGITRGQSKVVLYGILYSAGNTLLGYNMWEDDTTIEFTSDEYDAVSASINRRAYEIEDGTKYFRVKKGLHVPVTRKLIMQTIYGGRIKQKFTSGITGYSELIRDIAKEAEQGFIRSVDGRRVYKKSDHSLLNYKLQSSGAVLTKYWVFITYKTLLKKYVLGKDIIPTGIVHDEVIIGSKKHITNDTTKILHSSIAKASDMLKLPVRVEIEHFVDIDWSSH